MEIGKKVKELRKMAKLTQTEFAKRAGVGLRFIRDLEQGKPTVRLDKVNQVLTFFGYHIEAVKNDRE
jgi:y4mF family transcriptional regulator